MSAPLLLTWLAGTLLPLGTLWLVYRLALRGERCFGYNRAFLLVAPVLAAALPLLPRPALPLWFDSPAVAVVAGKTGVAVLLPTVAISQAASAEANWSIWTWLGVLYFIGLALGLGRIVWQAMRLWWLARRLPREHRPGYVLAYTGGRLPTSSFGQVVFWDETAGLSLAEELAVLTHEVAHVRQHHTLDVLWLEVWRAVLWPNPFVHLVLPAVRLTHELLADAAAAPETGASAYPTLLARLAARQLGAPAYSSLLQPFTFSFTLTRIAMLQNQNPVRRWKQWLVLPALCGLFLAACQSAPAPVPAVGPPAPAAPVALAASPVALDTSRVYTYVEQMPQLPGGGGQQALVEAVVSNLNYQKLEKTAKVEGRVFVKFTVDATGHMRDVEIVKGLTPAYDEAVLAAVRQLPAFEPGKQGGQAVSVSFTLPVTFHN